VFCNYPNDPGTIPDSVANVVWGAVSATCNYQPGNPNTIWHYGCSLGVPIGSSIVTDSPGWSFTTKSGDPQIVYFGSVQAAPGVVRASAVPGGSSARAAGVVSSARVPRTVLGPLRFAGHVSLGRGVRLRRMHVVVERTLFEHGRREELARSRWERRPRPPALRHVRGGLFTSAGRSGTARVRLKLLRLNRGGTMHLDLRLTQVRIRDVRALCTVMPAGVSRAGRPLELETRLRLRDRGVTRRIAMRQRWRCVRDRKGEFTGIRPVRPRPTAARPGLAVSLRVLPALTPGRRASALVTVTNRRPKRPTRVVSSLWHLRITGIAGGRPRTIGLRELRARRSRTVRLRLPVPRAARRQLCVQVTAGADSARPAHARRCVRIANAPRFTG
jgi:hypothetical protein